MEEKLRAVKEEEEQAPGADSEAEGADDVLMKKEEQAPGADKEDHRREVDVADSFPWRGWRKKTTVMLMISSAKSCSAAAPLPDHVDDQVAPKPRLTPWRDPDLNRVPPPPKRAHRNLADHPAPNPLSPAPRHAPCRAADPVPPPKAASNRAGWGRKTTAHPCEHWDVDDYGDDRFCRFFREDDQCFFCAVHCIDEACPAHHNKPGSCEWKGCGKQAPYTERCSFGMCREHCLDWPQCEPHSKDRKKSCNRVQGLRASVRSSQWWVWV